MTAIVTRGAHQADDARRARIQTLIADLPRTLGADSSPYDAVLAEPAQVP
jgi:hypothetical protein